MTELWACCQPCDEWFIVPDARLDAYFLCPVCLAVAERWEERPDGAGPRTADGAA